MNGVLPDHQINRLIADGAIAADTPIGAGQVQPASLDLRLGTKAVRLRASFLSGQGKRVADRLDDFAMHSMDLRDGAVLEKGCVYLVPLMERLRLPKGVVAAANAKSSTGRLDLLTRLIADDGTEFDRLPDGYEGPLYAEICPRSFSVLVRPGMRLNQLRLRQGQAVLDDAALSALHGKDPLVDGPALIDGGLGFSVDLSARGGSAGDRSAADRSGGDQSAGGLVGYRAKKHTGVIDLDRIGSYPAAEFWDRLSAPDRRLILDPGAFYILVSREAVIIPPDYAAEMSPYLAMVGEFRVHYAGFFDPGFGHGAANGTGSRGVLEVRCHEAPFALEHGQSVGRLVYERMAARPDRLYGADLKSNYQGQGLKLSKHFND
ncbi:2'-deoxycytidine 5'-triphosphate deaminase [Paracoccus pacificus]|uniref:2'-deoxycytidine 5'-triphosphate deaminase n=1 Tax=Paracoccus pacificus TaxID=1463598 RepID=A0ABW4R3V9_9RHOB